MSHEFKTESGAEVIIRPASFQDANRLRKAISSELKNVDGGLDIDVNDVSPSSVLEKLPGIVFSLDSSDAVEKAVFECLKQCTRDGARVTPETFDDPAAREDYYPIIVACMRENLRPFIKGLVSSFATALPPEAKAQK